MSDVSKSNSNRVYVLDTNVLLHDPRAMMSFEEHEVLIPLTVIEEIDRFKKDGNELGRNARQISRILDSLRKRGSLKDGVKLDNGGLLRVDYVTAEEHVRVPWGGSTNDNRILKAAWSLKQKGWDVILITRDTNMRLKGDALGLRAEDYRKAHIVVDEQYSGVFETTVTSDIIDEIFAEGSVSADFLGPRHANQFVVMRNEFDDQQSAMARIDPDSGRLVLVPRRKDGVWGIRPRNKEQMFAMDLLMDDRISMVTVNGVAGTGKTLLALACGLAKVADEQVFRKLLVSRPIMPMGRDVGFLPGDIEQKLNPWMKPIFDNLELIVSSGSGTGRGDRSNPEPSFQYLLDKKIIEIEPLTYIRGRSLPAQYLIVDEAQNLTPHEVKTILTRAGEGTKIILTGDPYQIDNPYVDALSNGLTYAVERFKDAPIAGHISLHRGERSELAEMAAKLF